MDYPVTRQVVTSLSGKKLFIFGTSEYQNIDGHYINGDPKKENKKTMTCKPETKVEVDPNVKEKKEIELLKKQTKLKGKSLQAACPSSEPAA